MDEANCAELFGDAIGAPDPPFALTPVVELVGATSLTKFTQLSPPGPPDTCAPMPPAPTETYKVEYPEAVTFESAYAPPELAPEELSCPMLPPPAPHASTFTVEVPAGIAIVQLPALVTNKIVFAPEMLEDTVQAAAFALGIDTGEISAKDKTKVASALTLNLLFLLARTLHRQTIYR